MKIIPYFILISLLAVCLIYFSIPYILHDVSIINPNAMLATYTWDTCGFILTLGFLPLLIVNGLAYIFIEVRKEYLKHLFLIPSILCIFIV